MQTRSMELERAKHVWQQAIEHLARKIATLPVASAKVAKDMDDESEADIHRWRWEHQITIYQMCIDWAIQQQDFVEGNTNESQALQRERFYRLMAVLAKAELDRDDHFRSAELVSSRTVQTASNQQVVEDLQKAASAALMRLVPGFAVAAA